MELKVEKREEKGKSLKKLRTKGYVPAVLYGPEIKENIILKVAKKEFRQAYKEAGKSSVINLKLGKETRDVFIHNVSLDPLSGEVIHIDFYQPIKGKETEIEVPLVFEGIEDVQKRTGGNLVKEMQSLEIKGMISDLPKEIVVDLSKLEKIGDKIIISDLGISDKLKVEKKEDDVVAIVVAQSAEKESEETATGEEEKEAESSDVNKSEEKSEQK